MKKMIAMMIALILCAGCLSGCFKNQIVPTNTEPTTEATEPTTQATEPTTEATEPTIEATEPTTEATEPTIEATEPTTPATEPATKPAAGELSNDPFSFQFSVNGTVLQLPCNVADFAALGLLMEEDKRDNTLDEGYGTSANLYDGTEWSKINICIYNNSKEPVLYENAMVESISFQPRSGGAKVDVRTTGNIGIGSTVDEVKSVFGEPTKTTEPYEVSGSSFYTMTFENTALGMTAFRQKIQIDMKDNLVYGFTLDSDAEYGN